MRARITTACVLVCAAGILAGGAARASDPPRLTGWDTSEKKFTAWQRQLLKRRSRPTEQMKRIFYRKITVPPPAAPRAGEGTWSKIKYHTRYDYGRMDPMGLFPGMPDLGVGSGDPTVSVSLKVRAGVAKVFLAEHDMALFAVGPGSDRAFGDSKTTIKAGLLGAALPGGGEGEAAWTYQLTGSGIKPTGAAAKIGGSYGLVSGGVGMTTDGKAVDLQLSAGVGPKIPENPFVQAGMAFEGDVSMPVVIEDVQWKSKHGVSQVAGRAAVKITRMLGRPIDCPYCKRRGDVTCRKCFNRRTVLCPTCHGNRKADCPGCRNGRVSCSTTQSCGPCRGYGRVPCGNCDRRGRVDVQRRYTRQETRSYKVPYTAGFDSNNNAIVKYRTEYRTVNVPYWQTESVLCNSCGGVGYLGRCSNCSGSGKVTCRICSGRGWYTHRRCGGTGKIPCGKCSGKGRVTCPKCRGRKIVCPLCKGRRRIGPGT